MPTVPTLEAPSVQDEPLPGRPNPRLDDSVSPAAFGTPLAAGIEDVSSAVTTQEAKAKQENDNLRVIDANTQLEAGRNALLYGTPDSQTGQMSGGAFSYHGTDAINLPGKMLPMYQQLAQGINSKLTPDQQRVFQTHIASGQNELNLQLNRYEYDESNRLADQTYSTAANQAVESASVGWRDPIQVGKSRADIKALISMQGDREGWSQPEKDAQAQKLLAEMHFSVVDRMLADGSPQSALAYFVGTKNDPGIRDSNELTGEQSHQLGTAIDAAIKQQGAQNQAAVASKVRDVRAAAINGQMIPPSAMPSDAELRSAYPDTWQDLKAGINRDVTMGADLKSFATLTPAELAAHVETYKPTQVTGAAEEYDRFNAAGEAAQRSLAERARDPRQFAIDNKLGSNPVDFGGDPQKMGAEINTRLANLPALSTQLGGYVPPLSKPEASQLSQSLEKQTPADRLRTLSTLSSSIGDDRGFQEVMRQVLPGSPVTAIVGSQTSAAAPKNPPVWFDGRFATNPADQVRILQGEQLLNPKKDGEPGGKAFPMPPDGGTGGLREQFANATGDVFRGRPELGEAYFTAFKSAYASLLSEKGDMSGNGNGKMRDQAISMATGNITTFHGDKVAVPTGMDPGRFETEITAAVAARAKGSGAPPDWADRIDGYKVREVGGLGSGRYQLLNGNMPLVRPDGKGPFEVDLNAQYLASNGAHTTPSDPAPAKVPAAPVGPVNTDQAGIPHAAGVPRGTNERAPPLNLPGGRGARGRTHPSQGEAPDL